MLVSVTVNVRVQGNANGLCAVDIYQATVKTANNSTSNREDRG